MKHRDDWSAELDDVYGVSPPTTAWRQKGDKKTSMRMFRRNRSSSIAASDLIHHDLAVPPQGSLVSLEKRPPTKARAPKTDRPRVMKGYTHTPPIELGQQRSPNAKPSNREINEWKKRLNSMVSTLRRSPPSTPRNEVSVSQWTELRSKLKGWESDFEGAFVQSKRASMVAVIDKVLNFEVPLDTPEPEAEEMATQLLDELDRFESFYPSLKALESAVPEYASPDFQKKLQCLTAWQNASTSINFHIQSLTDILGSVEAIALGGSEQLLGLTGRMLPAAEKSLVMAHETMTEWTDCMVSMRLPPPHVFELSRLPMQLLSGVLDAQKSAADTLAVAIDSEGRSATEQRLSAEDCEVLLAACRETLMCAGRVKQLLTRTLRVSLEMQFEKSTQSGFKCCFDLLEKWYKAGNSNIPRFRDIFEREFLQLAEVSHSIPGGEVMLTSRFALFAQMLLRNAEQLTSNVRIATNDVIDLNGHSALAALMFAKTVIRKLEVACRFKLPNARPHVLRDHVWVRVLVSTFTSSRECSGTSQPWRESDRVVMASPGLKPAEISRILMGSCRQRECDGYVLIMAAADAGTHLWSDKDVEVDVPGPIDVAGILDPGEVHLVCGSSLRLPRIRHKFERAITVPQRAHSDSVQWEVQAIAQATCSLAMSLTQYTTSLQPAPAMPVASPSPGGVILDDDFALEHKGRVKTQPLPTKMNLSGSLNLDDMVLFSDFEDGLTLAPGLDVGVDGVCMACNWVCRFIKEVPGHFARKTATWVDNFLKLVRWWKGVSDTLTRRNDARTNRIFHDEVRVLTLLQAVITISSYNLTTSQFDELRSLTDRYLDPESTPTPPDTSLVLEALEDKMISPLTQSKSYAGEEVEECPFPAARANSRIRAIMALDEKRNEALKAKQMVGSVVVPSARVPKVASRHDLLSPSPFKHIRYQKGARIGVGSGGQVFLCRNTDTGEPMAVKEIRLHDMKQDQINSIRREVEMMEQLQHPNIVRFLGTECKDHKLLIFMEFCDCGSLSDILKSGPFVEPIVAVYARQLLLGLQYLHEQNIIHRDLKCANILVPESGVLKLADFGCSKSILDGLTGDANHTLVCGTPQYMAPECILDSGYGRKIDIWSLGCCCLEMLTGHPPWQQFTEFVALIFHIGRADRTPPFPDTISPTAEDFLRQCFQRDPEKRPDAKTLLLHPFVCETKSPETTRRNLKTFC